MKLFDVVEIGNGPWSDPIEAVSLNDAIVAVRTELQNSNPSDYCDGWTDGDDRPTVEVSIRDCDTDEVVERHFTVGA